MDRLAQLEIHRGEDGALRLLGEIDLASARLLQAEIDHLLTSPGNISLDMSSVTFMDAAGAHVLLHALEALDPNRLLLISPSRQVRRLLDLTGLSERRNLGLEPDLSAP
jgi:anti-anti-sigma factor